MSLAYILWRINTWMHNNKRWAPFFIRKRLCYLADRACGLTKAEAKER